MKNGGPNFKFDDLNWKYSLEDLDSFKDLAHLVHISLSKIKENISGARPYFYVLQQEFREYREVVREGIFAIPEDSSLITYLAIKNEIINREDMSNEDFFKQAEEDVLDFLFSKELAVNVFLPIVYRFRLLGFIAVSLHRKNHNLSAEEEVFLTLLKESLKVNLYAAILIDKRFYELLSLVDLNKKLEQFEYYEDAVRHIAELALSIVNFDKGVFYEYDAQTDELIPRSLINLKSADNLKVGESISGYVFEKRKPAIINNLKEHVFFNDINREKFIKFSFISIPFVSARRKFGVLTITNKKEHEEFSVDHLYLLRIIASFIVDYIDNKSLYELLKRNYFETVSALSSALEAKDKYTRGHSERVMYFAIGIGEELGLSKDALRNLRYAAVLHDIGKIGISESIITKPGRLSDHEWEVIQSHPQIGADILASIDFLKSAREFVRFHHERFDGTGYYSKQKEDYPFEATIIALADSYDALTSDRPYRKAILPEVAIKELKKSVGKRYDAKVFDAFVAFLKREKILRHTLPV